MKTSEYTENVFRAMTEAAKELTNPAKSETVSTGKYQYTFAPLPDILDDVRGLLGKHDLAVIQEAIDGDEGVGVTTRLIHASGEWIEYGPLVLPANGDAQSYGSAITYARRYALTAALGIAADEDDDAGKAKAKPKAEKQAEPGSGGRKATQPQIKKLAVIAGEQGWDDEERRRRANVASFTDLTMRSASDLIEEWSKLPVPQDSPATESSEGSQKETVSESEGESTPAGEGASSDAGERDELWSKFVRYLSGQGDGERAEERAREIAMEQIGTYDPDLKALGPLVTKVLREGIK